MYVVPKAGGRDAVHGRDGRLVRPAIAPDRDDFPNFLIVQGAFLPPHLPRRPRGTLASKAALSDQIPLEFRKGTQQVQEHPTLRTVSFNGFGQASEADASALEVLKDPDEVTNRPGKPVELVDDECVPRLETAQQLDEFGPVLHR